MQVHFEPCSLCRHAVCSTAVNAHIEIPRRSLSAIGSAQLSSANLQHVQLVVCTLVLSGKQEAQKSVSPTRQRRGSSFALSTEVHATSQCHQHRNVVWQRFCQTERCRELARMCAMCCVSRNVGFDAGQGAGMTCADRCCSSSCHAGDCGLDKVCRWGFVKCRCATHIKMCLTESGFLTLKRRCEVHSRSRVDELVSFIHCELVEVCVSSKKRSGDRDLIRAFRQKDVAGHLVTVTISQVWVDAVREKVWKCLHALPKPTLSRAHLWDSRFASAQASLGFWYHWCKMHLLSCVTRINDTCVGMEIVMLSTGALCSLCG